MLQTLCGVDAVADAPISANPLAAHTARLSTYEFFLVYFTSAAIIRAL